MAVVYSSLLVVTACIVLPTWLQEICLLSLYTYTEVFRLEVIRNIFKRSIGHDGGPCFDFAIGLSSYERFALYKYYSRYLTIVVEVTTRSFTLYS